MNTVKNLLLLLIMPFLFLSCHDSTGIENPETGVVTLTVSQKYAIDSGIGLRFNGMPCEESFSLSHLGSYDSVNMFYDANEKEINFFGCKLEIVSVDKQKISFKYIDKEDE